MNNSYSQSITREHRTAFLLLLDRSGSMRERVLFDGHEVTKASAVAETANRFLFELVERARRSDGVRDYYDIAVLSYSGDTVESLLTERPEFISVSELARRRTEQSVWSREHELPGGGHTIMTTVVPRYILPYAEGRTPMFEAMDEACVMLRRWCGNPRNAESFPPVVLNITDGEFSDCGEEELVDISRSIRSLGTADGNVLMLNIHITSGSGAPIIFPTEAEIPQTGRNAEIMARCSSLMPASFEPVIRRYRGLSAEPPFIGMSYNAPITEMLNIINIGSISVNNLE